MTDRDPALTRGEHDNSENAYWLFSVAFYARQGISDLLLSAQNDHALDINMILYALWQAAEGAELSPDDFSRLNDAGADWRKTILLPMRAVRYSLKSRDKGGDLYARAKMLELSCEKVQQKIMYEHADRHRKSGRSEKTIELRALDNLASYGEALGLSLPEPMAGQLARELREFVEA